MTRTCCSIITLLVVTGCISSSDKTGGGASSTASTTSSGSIKSSTLTFTKSDSVIHTGGDIKAIKLDSVIHTGGDNNAFMTAGQDDVTVNGTASASCDVSLVVVRPENTAKQDNVLLSCGPRVKAAAPAPAAPRR